MEICCALLDNWHLGSGKIWGTWAFHVLSLMPFGGSKLKAEHESSFSECLCSLYSASLGFLWVKLLELWALKSWHLPLSNHLEDLTCRAVFSSHCYDHVMVSYAYSLHYICKIDIRQNVIEDKRRNMALQVYL